MGGLPDDPPEPEPQAYFAPCDQWRLSSDYVKYLAERFDKGVLDPLTGLSHPAAAEDGPDLISFAVRAGMQRCLGG